MTHTRVLLTISKYFPRDKSYDIRVSPPKIDHSANTARIVLADILLDQLLN